MAIIRYAFRISKQEGNFSFLAVWGYRKCIRLHYENVKDKLEPCVKDKLEPLARLSARILEQFLIVTFAVISNKVLCASTL